MAVSILGKSLILQCIAELRADWMSNIFVLTICSLAARHCNEQSCFAFNNFYIMYNKAIVKSNGDISLKLTVSLNFSDSHFCNFHKLVPPLVLFTHDSKCRLCCKHRFPLLVERPLCLNS